MIMNGEAAFKWHRQTFACVSFTVVVIDFDDDDENKYGSVEWCGILFLTNLAKNSAVIIYFEGIFAVSA